MDRWEGRFEGVLTCGAAILVVFMACLVASFGEMEAMVFGLPDVSKWMVSNTRLPLLLLAGTVFSIIGMIGLMVIWNKKASAR